MTGTPPGDAAALRAEHDRLVERLSVRTSVDEVQKGGVLAFFTVLALGLTAKLAWDRWGWIPPRRVPPPPGLPMYFLLALLLTAVLAAFAARAFLRGRALRREEHALHGRLEALRRQLGLDP